MWSSFKLQPQFAYKGSNNYKQQVLLVSEQGASDEKQWTKGDEQELLGLDRMASKEQPRAFEPALRLNVFCLMMKCLAPCLNVLCFLKKCVGLIKLVVGH